MKLLIRLTVLTCLLFYFSGCTREQTLAKSTKAVENTLPNGFPKGASFAIIPNGKYELSFPKPRINDKIKESLENMGYSVTSSKNAEYIFTYDFIDAKTGFGRGFYLDKFSYIFTPAVFHNLSTEVLPEEVWRGMSWLLSPKKDFDEEILNELIDSTFNSFGRNDTILFSSKKLRSFNDEIQRYMTE